MARLEAVLVYRPGDAGSDGEFRIVASSSPTALREIARAALSEARAAVATWRKIDPQIAAMRQAEADRLASVLDTLLPDDSTPPPPLRFIPGEAA